MNKDILIEMMATWDSFLLVLDQVKQTQENFNLLIDIALNSNEPNSWRAAWMVDKVHDDKPEFVKPFINEMINRLKTPLDNGKKRHFLKLIAMNEIPKEHVSFLLGFCLEAFTNAKEPIAIRVHAMQVLYNISEVEPDFKSELAQIIEHEIEYHPSAGIISRGRKLLKKLYSSINKS